MYYRIWLEVYKIICVRSVSFAKSQQAFKIKPVNTQSRSPRTLTKRRSADTKLSNYPETETAIFIAVNHDEAIMAVI